MEGGIAGGRARGRKERNEGLGGKLVQRCCVRSNLHRVVEFGSTPVQRPLAARQQPVHRGDIRKRSYWFRVAISQG